ncbi:MAG: amino acid ABC transporter substrate-binding protein [Clostridiales bacterium]|jgi:polar amino acid transport system substrate-binding protein|nr:amino acid ABC transporter substrate-binding protein [Clostridiales bacterium]
MAKKNGTIVTAEAKKTQKTRRRVYGAFAVLVAAAMLLAVLTACGGQTAATTTQAAATQAAATTAAATEAATTTTAAPVTTTTTAAATTTTTEAATTTTTEAATTQSAATLPAPAPAADGSWEKIQQAGVFVLGLDDEFPPMGFRDEQNEIVGFDVDMAKAAAEYLGVKVELKPVIWDTVLMSLNSGEIDCIWNGFSVTEDRKKEVSYSKSYINSDQIVVTLTGSDITTKAGLAGMTVGTQMGSSTLDALDTDPATRDSFGELREYATFTAAMMDLDNKRLDAVVIDSVAFYGDFNVKSPEAYAVLEENFGREEMAIGVRQADNTWRETLNGALDYLRSSGKAAEISIKWFGKDVVIV